jgi:hypothetical protein
MELIRLFLPVIWAFTGTIIGLVLYRSSAAFFEQTKRKEGEVRRIRLVGSICIAGVVFLGLWNATPASIQKGVPDDAKLVRRVEVQAAAESLEQANAAATALIACATITPPAQCRAELQEVLTRIGDSVGRVRQLMK